MRYTQAAEKSPCFNDNVYSTSIKLNFHIAFHDLESPAFAHQSRHSLERA